MRCARCLVEIPIGDEELCWYCEDPLCIDCWDLPGVCGCPGSERAQWEIVTARSDADRARVMARPGPIGTVKRRFD